MPNQSVVLTETTPDTEFFVSQERDVDKIYAQFKIQASTKELHLTESGVAAGRGTELPDNTDYRKLAQASGPPTFAPMGAGGGGGFAPAPGVQPAGQATAAPVPSQEKIYVPGLGEVLASSVPPEALARMQQQQKAAAERAAAAQPLPPPRVNYEEASLTKKDRSWLLPLGIVVVLLAVLGFVFRNQLKKVFA